MENKIYLVIRESKDDGPTTFNVVPCATKETAKKVMQEEINKILSEGHFSTARKYMDGNGDMEECSFMWENENEDCFYIEDLYDNYLEDIRIDEKEVL